MMKKKIGVITFWGSKENYGQLLQMYALQKYLTQNCFDAFLIRYNRHSDVPLQKNSIRRNYKYFLLKLINPKVILRIIINHIKVKYLKLRQKTERKNHPRYFDDFIQSNVTVSEMIYNSIEDLRKYPPKADIYITGSDVVWSSPRPAYYLDFGPVNIKRISYAASFGRNSIFSEECKTIAPFLKKFNLITVRESVGIDLCAKAGRNDAKFVLDPTFLLSKDFYEKISKKTNIPQNFCFLYLLGNKSNFSRKQIVNTCKDNNLDIIYTTCDRFDHYKKVYPTVNEWLGYYENANIIITNSYHGCIFAIIFNKNFIFLPLTENYAQLNVRVESLLKELNLLDRICKNNFKELFNKDIKYCEVNNKLSIKLKEINKLLLMELNDSFNV